MDNKIVRGQILKDLRTEKKLNQTYLANMLGISLTAYQKYEHGIAEPNFDNLLKLADFYGVTTDYLLGREPLPDPFADLNLNRDNEKDVIEKYMSLSDETRAVLLDILIQLGEAAKGKQQQIHNSIQQSSDRMITNRIVAFGGNNAEEEISENEFIERYKAIKERKKREREEKK